MDFRSCIWSHREFWATLTSRGEGEKCVGSILLQTDSRTDFCDPVGALRHERNRGLSLVHLKVPRRAGFVEAGVVVSGGQVDIADALDHGSVRLAAGSDGMVVGAGSDHGRDAGCESAEEDEERGEGCG